MKFYSNILMAGALLASMAFASQADPFREERFKMKTGRYTPAEEARRLALNHKEVECGNQACCRNEHSGARTQSGDSASAWVNRWFQAKWGRPLNDGIRSSAAIKGVIAAGPNTSSMSSNCNHQTCCD